MWQIVDDKNFNGFFLSLYKYEEEGHVGDDYQIVVREGDGFDPVEGDWLDPISIAYDDHESSCWTIGEAFVMGVLTERESKNG